MSRIKSRDKFIEYLKKHGEENQLMVRLEYKGKYWAGYINSIYGLAKAVDTNLDKVLVELQKKAEKHIDEDFFSAICE
ncbi:MAG: hypothetical protein GY861_22180 [bacterium]|nr:hypothetical protein [bacterium]